jgi:hypothetical protein
VEKLLSGLTAESGKPGAIDNVGRAFKDRSCQPSVIGWILFKVGILNDDQIADSLVKAGTQSRTLAIIGRVMEHADSRIDDPSNRVAGTISRAVVDKKHLKDQHFFEDPSDALPDMVDLVEARDDDRQATATRRITHHERVLESNRA